MTKSSRGVLDRLQDHLERVAASLSTAFAEASEKHAGTSEAVAAAREHELRQVVRRFFPHPFKVTKGAVYDTHGGRSNSIDCVICAPNHPYLVGNDGSIEIILVDGTFAAIELKPDLTDLPDAFGANRKSDAEIIRGLKQIRSLKALRRTESAIWNTSYNEKRSPELLDYAHRCPGYVVADHSAPICDLAKYIADYYIHESVPPSEQVDVVYVINNGLILNSKCPDKSYTQPSGGTWYPHLAAFDAGTAATTRFLQVLVGETPPELLMSEPVLARYLRLLPQPSIACGHPTTTDTGKGDA